MALIVSLAAGAVVLIWNGRGTTFYADEWRFYAQYHDVPLKELFHPINGHLLILPILAYKAVLNLFGADSFVPFRILAVALQLLGAGLFFKLLSSRVGEPAALAPTIILLLLGAGWEVVEGAYAIFNMMAIDAGLAMLLALERRTIRGDLVASALLLVSLGSFGIGLSFAAGAAVQVLLRPAGERGKRSWVPLVPLVLFIIWELWARGTFPAEASRLTAASIAALPGNVMENFAFVCAAVTGLFRLPGDPPLSFDSTAGVPIAGLLGLGAAYLITRRPRPLRPEIWIYLAMLASYWTLISLVVAPSPGLSRYLYPGTLFLLLFVGELTDRSRVHLRGFFVLAVATAVALVGNLTTLFQSGDYFRAQAGQALAELAAVEGVRGQVQAGFPIQSNSPVMPLFAGEYFAASRTYGTPAYSLRELRTAPDFARLAADDLLVRAYRLKLRPVQISGPSGPIGRTGPGPQGNVLDRPGECLQIDPRFPVVTLGSQPRSPGIVVKATAGSAAQVSMGRFLDLPAVPIGNLAGGRAAAARAPGDRLPLPWKTLVTSEQTITICSLAGHRSGP